MNWEAITEELVKPLDKKHVRPPAQGKFGDYVEAWHVINEANRIFGFNGWTYDLVTLVKTNQNEKDGRHHVGYAATVRLTVDKVERTDVGHGQGHHPSEGEAHDSAIKEAVTDALKRALRTFGNPFGLALYDKSHANVADHDAIRREEEIAAKREEAITGDREAIGMADSMDELQSTFQTVVKTWRTEFKMNPPQSLIDAKDQRKEELTEEPTNDQPF